MFTHTSGNSVFETGFYSTGWDFTVRSLLGKTQNHGADPGEVLSTIVGIKSGDGHAWFSSWLALGDRIMGIAETSAAAGHRVSAAAAYLRAANYYAVCVGAIDGLGDDTSPLLPVFRKHRSAWEQFVALSRWNVEPVEIPYEGTTMPGWFFTGAAGADARPTLVMNNGSDGAVSGVWCEGAEAALERGYNVLMFDGPGQQSMLFERGIPFRHDWEAVLTPVVDFLLARTDVDRAKLALYGVSQAGYWVPRTLAFEHRFAAAIADGGVVDVSRAWFHHIPKSLMPLFEQGQKEKFDRDLALGMKVMPGAKAGAQLWAFRARPYGTHGYWETLHEVSKYVITAELAGRIDTALYITDCEDEQFYPGQSAELATMVAGSTVQSFTAAEGANFHCQPMARALTEQRMFDWLDEQIQS